MKSSSRTKLVGFEAAKHDASYREKSRTAPPLSRADARSCKKATAAVKRQCTTEVAAQAKRDRAAMKKGSPDWVPTSKGLVVKLNGTVLSGITRVDWGPTRVRVVRIATDLEEPRATELARGQVATLDLSVRNVKGAVVYTKSFQAVVGAEFYRYHADSVFPAVTEEIAFTVSA